MAKSEQKGGQIRSIDALDFSGGEQSSTVPALSRDDQLLMCHNGVIGDIIGAIVGRHGTTVKNETAKTIVKLGIYRNGTTRKYFIVASDGSNEVVYTVPNADFSGTLTAVLSGHFTDDTPVYSATFAGKEMFFNGNDDPKQTSDFSTFSTITDAPAEGKFPAVFQQRLYVFGVDGFLHYSDVINADGDGFTTDTWTNRGINPNDGQTPMGLVRHRGRLILFKDNSLYRFDGTNEPEPTVNIGLSSENGYAVFDTALYFHYETSIFEMSLGDPFEISRPVRKYLNSMPSANWSSVSLGRSGKDLLYCALGDVTIDDPHAWDNGETYSNVVLVWDRSLERWTVYTGWAATLWLRDLDNDKVYFAQSDGDIVYLDPSVFTDDSNPIQLDVMLPPIDYGIPMKKKKVDLIQVYGSPGLSLKAGNSVKGYMATGVASEVIEGLTEIKEQIEFSRLWVRFGQSYSQTPPRIEQLHIGYSYARDQV